MADMDWLFGTLFGGGYEGVLDDLFKKDLLKYFSKLEEIKSQGYKVYRNSDGKHKVVNRNTKQ